MNERIKKLRKALGLTQQEFGSRIGTTANVLTNYETGRRNPSSSVINNICKEFGVNEEWLRGGKGEMLVEVSKDKQISNFIENVLAEESKSFKRRLITLLSQLDDNDWEVLERMALQLAGSHTAIYRAAKSQTHTAPEIINDTDGLMDKLSSLPAVTKSEDL